MDLPAHTADPAVPSPPSATVPARRRGPGPLALAWLVNIGLWVVCAGLLASHRQGLLANAERESVTVARLVEQNVVALLDKAALVVASTAAELDRQLAQGGIDQAQLWRTVDTRAALVPQVLRVGVFDSAGHQVCGPGTDRCLRLEVADRDFFQHHRSGSGTATALHGPHPNRVDGQPAMVLSRALRRPDGSFAGVVMALLPLPRLQDVVSGIDVGPHGAASVRGADLQLLARQPALPPLADKPQQQTVSPRLRAALAASSRTGTLGTVAANDGVQRVTAFREVADYPLLVLVGVATADTLAGWYRLVAATAGLLLLAAGASVVAVRLARADATRRAAAQALYDSAPCGYHRLDAQGTIVDINSTELGWLGLPRDQVVGRMPFTRFLTDAGRDTFATHFPTLQRGQPVDDVEFDLVGAHGHTRRVLVNARPVLDAQGRFLMSNAVMQDITALKRADALRMEAALLAAQNAQLEADNRFKTALLSNLSHEMRTPLNAVTGFAGLLQSGSVPLPSPKAAGYIDRIQQAGRQLLGLVETMLALGQAQSQQMALQPQRLDVPALRALLQDTAGLLQSAADARQLQPSVFVDDGIGAVTVDPAPLRQLVAALLDNAIKFSHPGGRIGLLALADGPTHWLLEVQDEGIGIAEADLARLFQPFAQADASVTRAHGGLGLGLAMAQRLAQAMGASLDVQSTAGQGSVFQLRLPRQTGEP